MAVVQNVTPIVDEFTRADGPIGGAWTVVKGVPKIVSNKLSVKKEETVVAYWNAKILPGGGGEAHFKLGQNAVNKTGTLSGEAGSFEGLILRYDPATRKGYGCVVSEEKGFKFIFIEDAFPAGSGAVSPIKYKVLAEGTKAAGWKSGDTLGFTVAKNELRCWRIPTGSTTLSNYLQLKINETTPEYLSNAGYAGVLLTPPGPFTGTSVYDDFGAGYIITVKPIADQTSAVGEVVSLSIKGENATEFEATGLPAGLTLTKVGTAWSIKGSPETTAGSPKTVTIKAKNPEFGESETVSFKWTITGATAPSWGTKPKDISDIIGVAVNRDLEPATGTPPIKYTATGLPTGLKIEPGEDEESATVTGKPTALGVKTVSLTAKNIAGSVTETFKYTIEAGPAPVISPAPTNRDTKQGVYAEYTVTASDVEKWKVTGLPFGLTMNTTSGVISGTPTKVENPTVTVTAENLNGSDAKTFKWNVKAQPAPSLTAPGTQNRSEGDSVNLQLVATDANEYEVDQLPQGLTLNEVTGLISGKLISQEIVVTKIVVRGFGGEDFGSFTWNVLGILASGPQIGAVYRMIGPDGTEAVFNDENDPDYVGMLAEVTGLDSPDVRENAENQVGTDGGIHGDFFYGRRPITLTGKIFNVKSVKDRNIKQTKMTRACNALREDAWLEWEPDGGEAQFVKVRRNQPLRITGAWAKDFQIQVVAADPRLYGVEVQTVTTSTEEAQVENLGDEDTYPIIRIKGEPEDIAFANGNTGETLAFHYSSTTSFNNVWAVIPNIKALAVNSTSVVAVSYEKTAERLWLWRLDPVTGAVLNKWKLNIPAFGITTIVLSKDGKKLMVDPFAEGPNMYSLSLTTGKATKANTTGIAWSSFVEEGTTEWFVMGGIFNIGRRVSGTETTNWVVGLTKYPSGITHDATTKYLYWGHSTGVGRIKDNGEGGSKNETFITGAGITEVTDITSDGTYLYWTQKNNTLWRAALAGTGAVQIGTTAASPGPIGVGTSPAALVWATQGVNSDAIGRVLTSLNTYELVFDFKNRTAYVAGTLESIYRAVEPNADWFPLQTGVTKIAISMANKAGEGNPQTTVEWRNAWI